MAALKERGENNHAVTAEILYLGKRGSLVASSPVKGRGVSRKVWKKKERSQVPKTTLSGGEIAPRVVGRAKRVRVSEIFFPEGSCHDTTVRERPAFGKKRYPQKKKAY